MTPVKARTPHSGPYPKAIVERPLSYGAFASNVKKRDHGGGSSMARNPFGVVGIERRGGSRRLTKHTQHTSAVDRCRHR